MVFFSKQTSIEIEQLNARVAEAETKLKTEVTRIKKKLHIQITELEMSLDVANKNNIELQKTIKKQSLHLTVRNSLNCILRIYFCSTKINYNFNIVSFKIYCFKRSKLNLENIY